MNNINQFEKRTIYDMYFDTIVRYNKIPTIIKKHNYNSKKMMTYFNKQKLKKKNYKKE